MAALFAMSLVVFLAMAALVHDLGGLSSRQAELQQFVDDVALAAAGELDGRTGAIARATGAANNLVFSSRGQDLLGGSGDFTLTFLASIPANDTTTPTDVTNDDADAVFAWVVAQPKSFSMIFLTAADRLLGGGGAEIVAGVSADAIAGFTQEACDITPLMFCLPPADKDAGDDEGFYEAENHIGALIQLRTGGNGADWGPGDFGFLDTSQAGDATICNSGSQADRLRCMLGAEDGITGCYKSGGVDTEPGQKVGITNSAFNTRFDIYEKSMKSARGEKIYRPARTVIKGLKTTVNGGNCKYESPTDTMPLPLDKCFTDGGCGASGDGRFGDGVWDKEAYIEKNYGDGDPNTVGDASPDIEGQAVSSDYAKYLGKGTRFETYLREVAYAQSQGTLMTGRQETGLPKCASVAPSESPWRRVITVAGVDCTANPINGSETGVPVQEYFEIFLTRPVQEIEAEIPEDKKAGKSAVASKFDIWGEVIGSLGRSGYQSEGDGGIFRDVVQLYR